MNRIFPILFILPSFFLAAEAANDERSQPGPRDPATGGSAKEARAALKPPAASATAGASATARGPRPLPNESEAVAAAIAAKGGAEYDTRGQVKLIHCDDASDADLRLFAGLGNLESLFVAGGTRITDAGLSALVKTRTLRHLAIGTAVHLYEGRNPGEPQISNEGLKSIGQLTDLQSLGLCVPQITGAGMAHLDGLKNLQFLNLSRSGVGDNGMRNIGGHVALRRLHLGEEVSRQGLAELVRLPSLDLLWIDRDLKDDDMLVVAQLTNLELLRCGLRGLTDEGLRYMKNMRRLRSLNLSEATKTTDVGMAYVAGMSGLETLELNRNISDAGITNVSELMNLKILNASCTTISDAGLAALTSLPQLRRLVLMHTRVTATGVAQLRGMKNLEFVDLDYTKITDEEVRELKDSGVPAFKLPRRRADR